MSMRPEADTRERLLETTIALIEELGPDEIRLKDITERAGVTNGAIYWSFKDRDALVDEAIVERYVRLLDRVFDDAAGRVDAIIRGDHDAELGGFVRRLLGPLGTAHPADERARAAAAASRHPHLAAKFHAANAQVVRRAGAQIRRSQDLGYVRNDVDALSIATFLNALSIGLATSDFLGDDGPTPENWGRLVNHLFAAFLTTPPSTQ